MKRWLIRNGMRAWLSGIAVMARRGGALAERWIGWMGTQASLARKVRPSADPVTLGETWQEAFPAKKHVPIVRVDETTAYGEIHTPCPLRGSGDVSACHRMMSYDRAFMARADARFVVLRSQAEPGVRVCEIAIRSAALPHDDLMPAHRRVGQGSVAESS